MGYAIGVLAAGGVAVFGRTAGFDRERAFYSTVLVVVAQYYVLFAAMGGSTQTLVQESIGLAAFAALAAVGFRQSVWIVAAGLAGHGLFDSFHAAVITNPGIPVWWPPFCIGFDVAAGVLLAVTARGPWERRTSR